MNYKDFVNDLSIDSISIKKLSFERYEFNFEDVKRFFFKIDSNEIEIIEKNDKELRLLSFFEFNVSDSESDEANKVFSAEVSFEIDYIINKISDISVEFIHEYGKDKLAPLIHPYLRQVISDSLQKANLPPFIIPPLEFVSEDMEDIEKEIDDKQKQKD